MEMTAIISVARHALQFAGGLLVMHGYLEETAIEFLVGGGVNLFALAWYLRDKRKVKK